MPGTQRQSRAESAVNPSHALGPLQETYSRLGCAGASHVRSLKRSTPMNIKYVELLWRPYGTDTFQMLRGTQIMYITQCLWSLKINSLGSVTACRNEAQQPKLSVILPPERHLLNFNRHLVNLPSSRLQISFWGDRNITTAQNQARKMRKYIFKHVFTWRDLKRFHRPKNSFYSVGEFSVSMYT